MGTAGIPITENLRPILEEVRKDLLDFGMRNPLLNYRLLKARGAESLRTDASSIFRQLVVESQEFEFVSAYRMRKREQLLLADGETDLPSAEMAWRQLPPEQQALWGIGDIPDGTFAAIHSEKDLESRLLATYYSSRSSIEEQGVNTLFIALGMLTWSDPAAPDDTHRAPLLLVPVELSRESSSEGFRLCYSGDDISPNVCLTEFLKQFEIAFDSGSEIEEFDVDHYFERFADAISANPTWSIDRHSVVLGFFSFSKFLMYRDLDPSTWPEEGALLKHGVPSEASFPFGNSYRYGVHSDRRVGRKRPLSLGESSFQGGKTGLFKKRRARQRRARRPLNQLASANEDSDEEADGADSRADRMTADVLWMTLTCPHFLIH